jgi:hypothetical protein
VTTAIAAKGGGQIHEGVELLQLTCAGDGNNAAAVEDRHMIAYRKLIPLVMVVSAAVPSAQHRAKPATVQVLWQFEAGG